MSTMFSALASPQIGWSCAAGGLHRPQVGVFCGTVVYAIYSHNASQVAQSIVMCATKLQHVSNPDSTSSFHFKIVACNVGCNNFRGGHIKLNAVLHCGSESFHCSISHNVSHLKVTSEQVVEMQVTVTRPQPFF